jgi:hypothetical protein
MKSIKNQAPAEHVNDKYAPNGSIGLFKCAIWPLKLMNHELVIDRNWRAL